jgi:hypothetical protein
VGRKTQESLLCVWCARGRGLIQDEGCREHTYISMVFGAETTDVITACGRRVALLAASDAEV